MSTQKRKRKHAGRRPVQRRDQKRVRRDVKDRLFRYLFGKDKEALLELYNALNGTAYEDPS